MILGRLAGRVRDRFVRLALQSPYLAIQRASPVAQMLLRRQWQADLTAGRPLTSIQDAGFKAFSQTDEDGILLYIFALIGVSKRRCVEVCAGNGIECNTANLIVNHGWEGLLVDADARRVKEGRTFYLENPHTCVDPPVFVQAWVTRDNVNHILSANGFTGEIDLMSIDLDGMDYWIWDAITAVAPRVVVVEYQSALGPERSVTVPYSENFDARGQHMLGKERAFFGASLPAFVKLARKKGYRLVGCNRLGYNAFFVHESAAQPALAEWSIAQCFTRGFCVRAIRERYPALKDMPWVEV